jgi:hypothetical protein
MNTCQAKGPEADCTHCTLHRNIWLHNTNVRLLSLEAETKELRRALLEVVLDRRQERLDAMNGRKVL